MNKDGGYGYSLSFYFICGGVSIIFLLPTVMNLWNRRNFQNVNNAEPHGNVTHLATSLPSPRTSAWQPCVCAWRAAINVNRKLHSIHSDQHSASVAAVDRVVFIVCQVLFRVSFWIFLRIRGHFYESFRDVKVFCQFCVAFSVGIARNTAWWIRSRLSTSCGGGFAFKMSSILGKIPKFTLKLPSALAKAGRTMSECPLVSTFYCNNYH